MFYNDGILHLCKNLNKYPRAKVADYNNICA
ncbi:hypothetical protein T12_1019 [Trichinella patagoniensis]|uniref:Uncharacterized protein n=1 Tax=Trichinella patagoniensis TaxID=990121 RepID=A0A0V0YV33_9BILA|nr:hypothetical protein T12_1019 [Trichinella patagoniensis]